MATFIVDYSPHTQKKSDLKPLSGFEMKHKERISECAHFTHYLPINEYSVILNVWESPLNIALALEFCYKIWNRDSPKSNALFGWRLMQRITARSC